MLLRHTVQIFSESEFAITNNVFYYNTETRRELTVRVFGH